MSTHETNPNPAAEAAPEPHPFRTFFRLLAGFIPFALTVYVVLVCAIGSLRDQVDKKNRHTPLGHFLNELPRNLDYRKGLYGHMFTRAREAKVTHDVDILFIGSSHAYRSFDPRIFAEAGFKTFNLGSSQQTHLQTHVLLKRYLEQMNPKVVVYEVFPPIFAVDGVESALDIIANDRNDLESIRMAFQINHLKVYNALIYGLYRNLFDLDADFAERLRRGVDHYIPGGYLQKKISYYEKKDWTQKRKSWRKRPNQVEAFERNLAMIRARGSRVILLQAPWPKREYQRLRRRLEFDEFMRSYGEYYNFAQTMKLDNRRHFYDEGHMNQAGVNLFNQELLRQFCPERIPAKKPATPATPPAGSP